MYKIYGYNKIKGWEIISTKSKLTEAIKIADKIDSEEYYSYLIKESNSRGDSIIKQHTFTQECKVEYSDNIKEKYEVRAITFKPSRMKKKEELRKITEEYIDR